MAQATFWELFPVRLDDGDRDPYEPMLYVGRWPD